MTNNPNPNPSHTNNQNPMTPTPTPNPTRRKFLSSIPLAAAAIPASLAGVGGGVSAMGAEASGAANEPSPTPQDSAPPRESLGVFRMTMHNVLHIPRETKIAMSSSICFTNEHTFCGREAGSVYLIGTKTIYHDKPINGRNLVDLEYTFAALDGPSSPDLCGRLDFSAMFQQPELPVDNPEGIISVRETTGVGGETLEVTWQGWSSQSGMPLAWGGRRFDRNEGIDDIPGFVKWVMANCERRKNIKTHYGLVWEYIIA